jgi:hypothetical protein
MLPSSTIASSPPVALVRGGSNRAAPLSRAASSRSAVELRCQNASCTCVLEPTSIPVDYDTILERLFGNRDAVDMRGFREAAARGDAATFTVLVAEASAGLACADGDDGALPGGWPYCDDCVEELLRVQKRRAADANERRYAVANILDGVRLGAAPQSSAAGAEGDAGAVAAAEEQEPAEARPQDMLIEILHAREAEAQKRLEIARERIQSAARARALIAAKRREAMEMKSRLWVIHTELSLRLNAGRERMGALIHRIARYRSTLASLRSLRAHSDAFFLWHSDPFATINGCRLGRAPSTTSATPDWPEVNAALGQFTTLLAETARRLGAPRLRWVLIPCGSYSKIAPSDDARQGPLELFYNGSFFGASRFATALRALIAALGELGAAVEANDPSFRLPHAITLNGEKCGGCHVSLGRDVPWTRAMRCAATNLKWLVAWSLRREVG